MDKFLDGLSKYNIHAQDKDGNETNSGSDESFQEPAESSSGSIMLTPATDGFDGDVPKDKNNDETVKLESAKLTRMEKELNDAKIQLARQRQELEQRNLATGTAHRSVVSPSGTDQLPGIARITNLEPQTTRNVAQPGSNYNQVPWSPMSISQSTQSDTPSIGIGATNIAAWPPSNHIGLQHSAASNGSTEFQPGLPWGQSNTGPWNNRMPGSNLSPLMIPPQQRNISMPISPGPIGEGRFPTSNGAHYGSGAGIRRGHVPGLRAASSYPQGRTEPWEVYSPNGRSMEPVNLSMDPNGMYQPLMLNSEPYQPRPIGTPLSPGPQDFREGQTGGTTWNAAVSFILHSKSCLLSY